MHAGAKSIFPPKSVELTGRKHIVYTAIIYPRLPGVYYPVMNMLRKPHFSGIICALAIGALLAGCRATPAPAPAGATYAPDDRGDYATAGWYRYTHGEYCAITAGEHGGAAQVGHAYPGEQLVVIAGGSEYSRVFQPGRGVTGYVPSHYLEKSDDPRPVPTAAPALELGRPMQTLCEEYITLRRNPERKAAKLATIPAGDTVQALEAWGAFARVRYGEQEGYVLSGYLKNQGTALFADELSIVSPSDSYSYADMNADLQALAHAYPDLLALDTLGRSEWGSDIPLAIAGDPSADTHILIHGGIHAREHLTSTLVMAQLEYALIAMANGDPDYAGVCFHAIPMVNPDGISLAQGAAAPGAVQDIIRDQLSAPDASHWEPDAWERAMGSYLTQWKANGWGVDLNRNFSAGWEPSPTARPGGQGYPGQAPEDQAESRALAQYTRGRTWALTLSYHAFGSLIYWNYANSPVNAACWDVGWELAQCTGYPLHGDKDVDGMGYKDWAILQGIPSLTIEIGTRECPLPMDEFHDIWLRNRGVWARAARWARGK